MAFSQVKKGLLSKIPKITKYITPKLRYVYIEPTNHCNLNCKMCFSRKRQRGYMNLQLFNKIIDELQEMNIQNLALHFGGESLLHPDFTEMLDYASSKRKYKVGFSTNGMLLNEEIAEHLVKCQIDWITFSLEGFAKTNDSIRLGCNYDKVKKNIITLVKKREDRNKPTVSITMTYIGQSPNEINAFVKYWIEKVDCIRLGPCLTEDLKIADASAYYNGKDIKENSFCTFPFGTLAILWDGSVTACCHNIKGLNCLGNANKESIKQIWKGSSFKKLRLLCIKHNFDSDHICYNCEIWKPYFKPHRKIINGIEITTEGLSIKYQKREQP